MPTLILPPRYTSDSNVLWRAALDENWVVERLQGWRVDRELSGDIAIYGEHLFAIAVAEQLSLALLRPPLNWLTQLPIQYLHRQIHYTDLSSLSDFGLPAFIKPADDKCFPAGVYDDLDRIPNRAVLSPQTPLLVAEPVTWQIEFRCFVLNRKVVTSSVYAKDGEAIQDDALYETFQSELSDALDFAHQVLENTTTDFPPSAVLDVGYIEGRGWAVVEANPSWGSGIYGCDPRQVLNTIVRGCKPMVDLKPEEKQWIVV